MYIYEVREEYAETDTFEPCNLTEFPTIHVFRCLCFWGDPSPNWGSGKVKGRAHSVYGYLHILSLPSD